VPVVRNIEGFTSSALPEGELLTQQVPDPRTGYDVTGCRYDSVNRAQNATLNGPALDDCRAYSTKVTGECGTLFYPLNA